MASFAASIARWIQPASRTPSVPNADAGGASKISRMLSSSRATMPDEFGGWVVTRTPRYVVALGPRRGVDLEVGRQARQAEGRQGGGLPDTELAFVERVEAADCKLLERGGEGG